MTVKQRQIDIVLEVVKEIFGDGSHKIGRVAEAVHEHDGLLRCFRMFHDSRITTISHRLGGKAAIPAGAARTDVFEVEVST